MPTDLDPRLRVLLLDEHDRARLALVRLLAHHPHILVVGDTADPLGAHELIGAARPHLALVDVAREDQMWPRSLASLAALPPDRRPVLVVHMASFDPDTWDRARKAGADTLILKHVGVESLTAALLEAAARLLPPSRWPAVFDA